MGYDGYTQGVNNAKGAYIPPASVYVKVQGGRRYLPVSERVLWFRKDHPDWSIRPEIIEINHEQQYAIFKTTIYNHLGEIMAVGHATENVKGFEDWIEKAESASVGRALMYCGYGTEAALELEEAVRQASKEADIQDSQALANQGQLEDDGLSSREIRENLVKETIDKEDAKQIREAYATLRHNLMLLGKDTYPDAVMAAYNKILKREGEAMNESMSIEGLNKCIDRTALLLKEREAAAT